LFICSFAFVSTAVDANGVLAVIDAAIVLAHFDVSVSALLLGRCLKVTLHLQTPLSAGFDGCQAEFYMFLLH
jgi:hypothetical protein